MEAGWKTFAVVPQHCSEAECLCIDLAERENREIFHMFISRTPRDKQPSLRLSLLLLKAQPAQVIKILPSQGEITLCLVSNVESWVSLAWVLPFLPLFISIYKMYLSSSLPHHLSFWQSMWNMKLYIMWRPACTVQQCIIHIHPKVSRDTKCIRLDLS